MCQYCFKQILKHIAYPGNDAHRTLKSILDVRNQAAFVDVMEMCQVNFPRPAHIHEAYYDAPHTTDITYDEFVRLARQNPHR